MKLLDREEWVSECYYGTDWIIAITKKLLDEGKSTTVIREYLKSLSITDIKINEVFTVLKLVAQALDGEGTNESVIEEEENAEDNVDAMLGDIEDQVNKEEDKAKSEEDEEDEEESEDDETITALKDVIKDAEKLRKIEKVLKGEVEDKPAEKPEGESGEEEEEESSEESPEEEEESTE